ncbi:PLDc N-terminal domain-containing protein [Acanthopleuribacter pedis]|uniref:PLDc N-terminal domain-containing protein n=1 Tax=Acanthopleuribacter pedis TaxID=442870 RepID=A0A8J7Q4D5_9BACT|nr:PLDc N-terminal domain-containing protein [Acanthopleuribacter pedis]MBO1317521.1 PLDc N-terminal domain-containing protein [Acanthopleuribacter pedis]
MEFASVGTLFGLVIFILDIIALFQILSSPSSMLYKVGWSLVILLLPLVGLILYAIFGGVRTTRVNA